MLPLGTVLKHHCPDCGSRMILESGPHGLFYGCEKYPQCRATHGAHQHNGKPFGIPASAETRQARVAAHKAFDILWISGAMTRTQAYTWLARQLGQQQAHIGQMNAKECEIVIRLVQSLNQN